jgi:hypothetical protein
LVIDHDEPLPRQPVPPLDVVRTAEPHVRDPVGSARQGLFAFLSYLAVSSALYGVPILTRFSSVYAGSGRGDADIYYWALSWWPHAIAHGLNPFFPKVVFAPQGLDLAWVTALPGPALVMWPVTVTFGALVSSNVLAVAAPALAAWGAYLVCRRVTEGRFPAALLGGYLFGFSSYMVAQMRGHVNLFLVFPVPLLVYLVIRWFDGSLATRRFVPLLALVLVGEFSISTEVFATMTLFGAIAMLGLVAFAPELRSRVLEASGWIALAYAVTAVVVAPYLYYVTIGAPPSAAKTVAGGGASLDLLSYLVPRTSALIGGAWFRHFTGPFYPNLSEDGGYLSPAIVVALGAAAWMARRDRVLRLVLAFGAVAAVLSLGGYLHVKGTRLFPLPWWPFTHLPVLQKALPQRFSLYVWLAVAVVAGRWLAQPGRVRWRYAVVALAAVLLLPNVADPGLHGGIASPTFFSEGLYRRYLAPGATIVIVHPWKGQEMLWQARSDFWFSMAAGHAGNEPAAFTGDPFYFALRRDHPGYLEPSVIQTFMAQHGVVAVVVADSDASAWRPLLERTFAETPIHVGGVELYRVPGASSFTP